MEMIILGHSELSFIEAVVLCREGCPLLGGSFIESFTVIMCLGA